MMTKKYQGFEQVEEVFTRDDTKKMRRMDSKIVQRWNAFVYGMQDQQKEVSKNKYLARGARNDIEDLLEGVSYTLTVHPEHGPIRVTDIYVRGFIIIKQNAHSGEYRADHKRSKDSRPIPIRKADCEVHASPIPGTEQGVSDLGLEVVDIYSRDQQRFGEYSRLFIPAMHLATKRPENIPL